MNGGSFTIRIRQILGTLKRGQNRRIKALEIQGGGQPLDACRDMACQWILARVASALGIDEPAGRPLGLPVMTYMDEEDLQLGGY